VGTTDLPMEVEGKVAGRWGGGGACCVLYVFLCFVFCVGSERPFSYSTNDTYFVESWISNWPKWLTFAHF